MLFSKLWLLLVAAAGTAAFGLALVVPQPLGQEITAAAAADLDRAQRNADYILRLEARDWIDTAEKIARDRVLVQALEETLPAVTGSTETVDVSQAKAKLQGRLLTLVTQLKLETRPKLVIAVDSQGKQIYRMGVGEENYTAGKDGLAGYPLVEQALRGVRQDDTWNIEGKLYMMAASPVVSRSRGQYVGALILGEALDDAFARRFKLMLGRTDVAVLLQGKVVGSSMASPTLDLLAKELASEERKKEMEAKGRSATVLLGSGSQAYYAVLTPLPGEASLLGAAFALLAPPPPPLGLPDVVDRLDLGELMRRGALPWPLLSGALVVALVIGLLLMYWEVSSPLSRIIQEMHKVTRGELLRVDARRFSGKHGKLAMAINGALEKAQALEPRSPPRGQSGVMAAVAAGPAPFAVAPQARPAVAPHPAAAPAATAQPAAPPPAESTAEAAGALAVPQAAAAPGPGPGLPATAPADPQPAQPMALAEDAERAEPGPLDEAPARRRGWLEPEDMATEISRIPPAFDGRYDGSDTVLDEPKEVVLPGGPPRQATLAGMGDQETVVRAPMSFQESEQTPGEVAVPSSVDPISRAATVMSSISESLARSMEKEGGDQGEEGEAGEGEEDLDQYIQNIYDEFMAMKNACGEDTSNLTVERFSAKLRKNRENLIQRFGCKTVKFQVYAKDGKAALKATPIKN